MAGPAADLLAWYDRHARALPWRVPPHESRAGVRADPYRVWLSEIMLQQTTVAAVIPYFEAFTARWPTVEALAAAPDDALRAAWAGLGYYRRAANLHACARAVAARGGFPETAEALRALPGVGAYTSAAIAAIAFGEAVPVVDGNVERVMARLLRLSDPLPGLKRTVTARLAPLVPQDRPGDFAQAMMDLGATVCTPRAPACLACPWAGACAARAAGDQGAYPVKAPRRTKPRRQGAAHVLVRPSDGAVWCERRADAGLLPGMTQVPGTPWEAAEPPPGPGICCGTVRHVFTHFELALAVWRHDTATPPPTPGWWSPPDALAGEAWPTVMVKVLEAALPERGRLRRRG